MQMPIFDTITQDYLQATLTWFHQVTSAGVHLMVILALMQFSLQVSRGIISGEGDALSVMILCLKQLIIIAILYYLLLHVGTLLPTLFNSFKALGIAGSTITKLDPSSVVSEGLAIASAILQSFNSWGVLTNIAAAIFGSFCCIATVLSYGLIAADLMITLIESYFLVAVSGLFIAFGATSYTLPMAREFLGMSIGVGIKLMLLYVMIAIGATLGNDWIALANQASQNSDWETFLALAVAAIIYYLIVKHIPARLASAASTAFAISHINDAKDITMASIAGAGVMLGMARPMVGGATNMATSAANRFSPNSFSASSNNGGFANQGMAKNMNSHFNSSSHPMRDVSPTGIAALSGNHTDPPMHLPGN